MARIWQEGFEDGLPNNGYLENGLSSQYIKNFYFPAASSYLSLSNGRNIYSNKSLRFYSNRTSNSLLIGGIKYLPSLDVLYFRVHLKWANTPAAGGYSRDFLRFRNGSTIIASLYQSNTTGDFNLYLTDNSVYASKCSFQLSESTWYKIDLYLNISTGEYELKIDDVTFVQDVADLGVNPINNIALCAIGGTASAYGNCDFYLDDMALNDNTGSINNSWCGSGTIVSIKPKATGNKSQWDDCKGYAKAESGTGTTTIKITGHGLSTNDVIYNKTRDAYRIVTVTDANTLTVSSVTSQAQNDVILLYKNVATITATSGTSTTIAVIVGHTMRAGDVIVNTTRSNAIRSVSYIIGNNVYVSSVTSQASGDSIKTFAFTPYTMTNHWEAVSNQIDPSPKLSYIQSATSGDIDTFDMEEIVADKGFPSNSTVVAVSHNTYAQEAGAGSTIKPVFRISGTDYEGDTISLSSGTLQYQQIYNTSPATSSAWSRAEVDGLEAGVKLG